MREGPTPGNQPRPTASSTGRRLAALEVGLILVVFFVHTAWPVPDVNETHYLAKAKHYWNPSWAPGDFFLDSADAHLVFYWTFGWVTTFLSLPAAAWVGRLLTWGLLAWAWRRLSWRLAPKPLAAVLSAALFVTLSEYGQMAGEWVVGGVEAKGFAYVFVLLGLERLAADRWNAALFWCGAAAAMHVIVGGWTLVALGFAWWLGRRARPSLNSLLPGLAGAAVLSLAGLLPAVALSWGASEETLRQANHIYVQVRLPHHLTPQGLQPTSVLRHLAMLVVFAWLSFGARRNAPARRLGAVAWGAVAIAAAGFAIGYGLYAAPELRNALLRYYWFRTSDALLPMATALLATCWLLRFRPVRQAWPLALLLLPAVGHIGYVTWLRSQEQIPRSEWPLLRQFGAHTTPSREAVYRDWLDMSNQIESRPETAGAVILAPRFNQTLRWRTGRAIVASWKDLPQNAEDIVRWYHRIVDVDRYLRYPSAERLREIGKRYDASYAILPAQARIALPVLYRNNSFALVKVPTAESQEPSVESQE